MTNRIFISTNNSEQGRALRGLFNGADYVNIRHLPIYQTLVFPDNCDVLYYCSDTNSFTNNVVDTDIILIKDSLTALPNYIQIDENRNSDFLLYHNQEAAHLEFIIPKFGQKTEGHHIANADNKYLPVFKIIFDGEDKKAQRIIEFLFPSAETILGKKLDLLHALLEPPTNLTDNFKEWAELKKAVKEAKKLDIKLDENAWNSFKKEVKGEKYNGPFDENYIKPLTKLRDALLGE